MTEQALAEQAAQEGVTVNEAVQGEGNQDTQGQQEQARDFEAEARDMGWVPEEEFRGPKDKWKPAEEFVRRGEDILPIVRSQNKKFQDKLREQEALLSKKDEEFSKRLERMEKMNKLAIERQKEAHQAELARLKSEMRKAVEDGDTVAFDKLETQREELSKKTFDEPDTATSGDDPAAIQEAWVAKNDWYVTDFEKAQEAERYSQWLAKNNPKITLQDNLAKTEAYMKEKHPELAGGKKKTAGNGHAAVDGGGEFPGAGRKEGPAVKLPSEARRQAEADVKAGLYKNVDDWAKVYFS